MEHLIDKSALAAEIEKRLEFVEKRLKMNNSYTEEGNTAWKRDKALYDTYNFLLSFINNLEVKEVDLNEATKRYATEGDEISGLYIIDEEVEAFKAGAKWQKAKDESITEDLGEYINELSKQFPEVSFAKLSRIAVRVAKWQREQMEKEYSNLNKGLTTAKGLAVTMAYDKGVADTKERMMAKAIDVKVKVDAGDYPYIPQMELYDYDKDIPLAKAGEKYKVVLIKED